MQFEACCFLAFGMIGNRSIEASQGSCRCSAAGRACSITHCFLAKSVLVRTDLQCTDALIISLCSGRGCCGVVVRRCRQLLVSCLVSAVVQQR